MARRTIIITRALIHSHKRHLKSRGPVTSGVIRKSVSLVPPRPWEITSTLSSPKSRRASSATSTRLPYEFAACGPVVVISRGRERSALEFSFYFISSRGPVRYGRACGTKTFRLISFCRLYQFQKLATPVFTSLSISLALFWSLGFTKLILFREDTRVFAFY